MADIEWRRIFLVSSSIFALLLVGGSIYLHLQQKNHFGRLRYMKEFVTKSGEEASNSSNSYGNSDEILTVTFPVPPIDEDDDDNSDETFDDDYLLNGSASDEESTSDDYYMNDEYASAESNIFDQTKMTAATRNMLLQHNMSVACLHCICETTTGCMPSMCPNGEPCGIYRISKDYWILAGSPLVQLDDHSRTEKEVYNNKDLSGYLHCVNDVACAVRTVLEFVDNYFRDCNGDGIIDCRDHIELHLLGFNCKQYDASPTFRKHMEQCLNKAALDSGHKLGI